MKNKIIAVDFDGTLCENKYPEFGEPRTDVIEKLKKEQRQGARVILWTCRRGPSLLDAIYWAIDKGIEFDAVNENLPETVEYFGGDTRKICADEYWDDRAVIPFDKAADAAEKIAAEKIIKELSGIIKSRLAILFKQKRAARSSVESCAIVDTICEIQRLDKQIKDFAALNYGYTASERSEI